MMNMIAVAILATAGSSFGAFVDTKDVDGVIRNLDLTTFPNSLGPGRHSGKATFADYGFVIVEKTEAGAKLIRRSDDTIKSFVILSDDPKNMRLCFYERIVRQVGATVRSYDLTVALLVTKSQRGMWTAEQIKAGYPGCHNYPPAA